VLAKIAIATALLVAGPALAFLVLFAGCGGASPFFGVLCGHNILPSLVGFTLVAWFVLASAAALARSLYFKE
jgi:hypothetical protein